MKNIFKKNQIIITALAIMIVIAGYLSFTNDDKADDKDTVQTANPDLDELATAEDGVDLATDTTGTTDTTAPTDTTTGDTTGTADTATDTNTTDTNATDTNATDTNAADELGDISDDEILEAAKDVADNGELESEEGVPGEAVLVSANTLDAGFFISQKLKREQTRAMNKDTLMDLIDSNGISAEQKQEAMDTLINLTSVAEKENATEMLLEARGFDGALVSIVDGKVDVVINAATLSDQELAIIEEVVKTKTDITAKNIAITPVVVAE